MIDSPQGTAIPPLINLVRAMRDCCQRQEGEICQKLGINVSQFACLLVMPETGELTIHQVAKAMELSPSRASRVVDSLVQENLLERKTSAQDRRQQDICLTSAGLSKWQTARLLLRECEQKLLTHLSTQKSQELEKLLTAVINAMTHGVWTKKEDQSALQAD
jgi:MarR family transcriptional regulator, organic hydroperoxide resistance regulator